MSSARDRDLAQALVLWGKCTDLKQKGWNAFVSHPTCLSTESSSRFICLLSRQRAPNLFGAANADCGPALSPAVAESRVLVVGAGGIGCELLKVRSLRSSCTTPIFALHPLHIRGTGHCPYAPLDRLCLFGRAV